MAARWAAGRKALSDPRHVLMLAFGFSSGLPYLLVFGTLSAWLRESGVPLAEIGLFSWVALAYSFKFVWAPVIDAVDLPILSARLGRRRAWMLAAQALVATGLLLIAAGNPAQHLAPIAAAALLTAFASATQDVVIDGWRIDAAETEAQGTMAALYQLGYRLSLICSGAGALYIADFISWPTAYMSMAGLTLVGMTATLLAPLEIAGRSAPPKRLRFGEAVTEPFADLWGRKGGLLVLILALVMLYRLPDFVAGVMANPLYIDTGFSKSEIASVSKIYGVWIGILGAFAGGIGVSVLGLMPCLLIGGAAAAGSNLMFALLAASGPQISMLTLCISVDNFAGGFAGTTLIAYMSGLTSPAFAATQYALLSSLYALPGKFVGGASGYLAQSLGYQGFFSLTASVGIPVLILCAAVWRLDRPSDQSTV